MEINKRNVSVAPKQIHLDLVFLLTNAAKWGEVETKDTFHICVDFTDRESSWISDTTHC